QPKLHADIERKFEVRRTGRSVVVFTAFILGFILAADRLPEQGRADAVVLVVTDFPSDRTSRRQRPNAWRSRTLRASHSRSRTYPGCDFRLIEVLVDRLVGRDCG